MQDTGVDTHAFRSYLYNSYHLPVYICLEIHSDSFHLRQLLDEILKHSTTSQQILVFQVLRQYAVDGAKDIY